MSNTYRLTNTRGEVRRERSLTTFQVGGAVYYDLDGFHFIDDRDRREPRRDWTFEGHVHDAAERFVIESYNSPVLVVDEDDGDRFVGIYGERHAHDYDGSAAVVERWRSGVREYPVTNDRRAEG